jgi:lysophospholipase
MPRAAPYFEAMAQAPPGGSCAWLTTEDGVDIRVGHWPPPAPQDGAAPDTAQGTVVIFPGRTEYVEKYGPLAGDLQRLGYAVATVDWRGQGIAARLHPDRRAGHVAQFSDYQRDVDALMAHVRALGLPEPYHLIGHSMGGCIALGTCYRDPGFASVTFSAPMWGIMLSRLLRPTAWAVSWASEKVGLSHLYAPTTGAASYVATAAFDDNTLTTDRAMFDFMQAQVLEQPDLQLGGPTIRWLREALVECRRLAALPAPDLPCVTFLGSREKIVDPDPIHARMATWPGGELMVLPGAEHEVLMERAATRARVLARLAAHFDGAAPGPGAARAPGNITVTGTGTGTEG